jgi:hypothetical protein
MKNLKIVDALYRQAVLMGVIPLSRQLDGIEIDIKVAKVVNCVSKTARHNNI